MSNFFNYLKINRSFEYAGSMESLTRQMEDMIGVSDNFKLEHYGHQSYYASARMSVGFYMDNGGAAKPIKLLVRVYDMAPENPVVHVTSEMRGEHSFVIWLGIIFTVGSLFSGELSIFWKLFIPFMFAGIHWFFHRVLRAQEDRVIDVLIAELGLREQRT